MSQQIAVRQQQQAMATTSQGEWQVMVDMARTLLTTGFLPQAIKTEGQAVAIILQGRELGIGPMAALGTINVIQGKPTISPQLMIALINRSGELEDMKCVDDGKQCVVVMKRKGRTPHSTTFSQADAVAAGLAGKDNWKKQPATMRQWRAIAACARVVFPDVILGLYTPDEMGADVNEDGEIVHTPAPLATFPTALSVQAPLPSQAPPPAPTRKEKLIDRIEQLYVQEAQLGGVTPPEECFEPLSDMPENELVALGYKVSARVQALEKKRESAPPPQPAHAASQQPEGAKFYEREVLEDEEESTDDDQDDGAPNETDSKIFNTYLILKEKRPQFAAMKDIKQMGPNEKEGYLSLLLSQLHDAKIEDEKAAKQTKKR